jgi:hypothetical protein
MGWWATKVRQAIRHLSGRVTRRERAELTAWLSPEQLALFEGMHRADQRHGLDVVAALRAAGHAGDDLLLAGLFHDAAKGPSVGLAHRVAWSLVERYGGGMERGLAHIPGFAAAFERLRGHPEASARLALEAGCPPRTADLIRHQAAPGRERDALALRLADEAS